ncbi:MAG: hypothetical protein ACXU82_16730 [Caulobacteraceae bacterium]
MEQRLEPEVFYGSAIAALCGLMFGLMLHVAWEKHPGGPQILLFSRAEAAEAHPDPAEPEETVATADQALAADLDTGYLPPQPLPVTRLHPEMFDVQPATAGDVERQDVDDLAADAAPPHDLD